MIQIWVEDIDMTVRKLPAEEYRVEGDPDESVIEIDLEDMLLTMPEELAEKLYESLAIYFAES
ncbi:MAG: hypothetical protein ABIT76_08835 [Chthoniobacterales bacterium]